jgi:hypothetical protein
MGHSIFLFPLLLQILLGVGTSFLLLLLLPNGHSSIFLSQQTMRKRGRNMWTKKVANFWSKKAANAKGGGRKDICQIATFLPPLLDNLSTLGGGGEEKKRGQREHSP